MSLLPTTCLARCIGALICLGTRTGTTLCLTTRKLFLIGYLIVTFDPLFRSDSHWKRLLRVGAKQFGTYTPVLPLWTAWCQLSRNLQTSMNPKLKQNILARSIRSHNRALVDELSRPHLFLHAPGEHEHTTT